MIIAIGNTKGGVGKSTIASNLSVIAAQKGKKILLVDADPQASSLNFRSIREASDIKATAITTPTLHKDLKDFDNFDLIIVDCGGRDSITFRSAILAADILIIPLLPSVYDIWASTETLEIVNEAMLVNQDLKTYFLLNMVMPNTIMVRETKEALDEKEVPQFATKIGARTAFKNAIMKGEGVVESAPKSKAADEMRALYKEIIELVN